MDKKKAVVLLSGGLDSTTTLYFARKEGYKCFCLIFDYGQRHKKEIKSAVKISKKLKCKYQIVKIKLPWSKSALTDKKILVPINRDIKKMKKEIPVTYVPGRNTIFLSFAISYAESINADVIFTGANAIDYSGYPDCRPNFYKAFQKIIKLGTKKGVEGKKIKIITPLIKKSKAEIVKLGKKLKIPFDLTWSCYKGGRKPCGKCDSCLLRKLGTTPTYFSEQL
ncbi:MAG: 7-cyano-7-deazaguanine synthase QueC [Candidatus Firestonebacteria bacterium]